MKDETLIPLEHSAQNYCFGCGAANEHGLQLKFSLAEDGAVVSLIHLPTRFSGPPGYLHGGILATLMDEAMAKTNRALKLTVVTRNLEVDYLRPAPIDTPLRLEGRHLRAEGRKHWCEAVLLDETGMVLTRGKGLFIAVDAETLARHRKNQK